jgi:hypothetical protein
MSLYLSLTTFDKGENMASVFINITTNDQGKVVRGMRILRSSYDKNTKRDNLKYLGTIPHGEVDIPGTISKSLTPAEREELRKKLLEAAPAYWQEQTDQLTKRLSQAWDANMRLATLHSGPAPTPKRGQ